MATKKSKNVRRTAGSIKRPDVILTRTSKQPSVADSSQNSVLPQSNLSVETAR